MSFAVFVQRELAKLKNSAGGVIRKAWEMRVNNLKNIRRDQYVNLSIVCVQYTKYNHCGSNNRRYNDYMIHIQT